MRELLIVGGGVAGLSAGIFGARAGLDTLVVSDGESILARNASLENYPGFPDGVDARRYLALVREQAETAGCSFANDRILGVDERIEGELEAGFVARGERTTYECRRLIAASWPDSDYLEPLDVGRQQRGSKHVVAVDRDGRTAVDGVYAAGRLAGEPHQAVVAAGHGAKVGLAAIQDSETAFYHDWVAPAGYFTGRGREVPPACEEIDDPERRRRDDRARQTIRDRFAEALDDEPTMHPSVETE